MRRLVTTLAGAGALLLAGCGGGGGAETVLPSFTLGGSVGDGPVVGARIEVFDRAGALLGTAVSDAQANFSLTLDRLEADDFPLRVRARGGRDLVTGTAPDFDMVSVVLDRSQPRANINPHSTLIVATAVAGGGIDAQRLQHAREQVLARFGFGLGERITDPISAVIDRDSAAEIVRASEGLGELLRRVRDRLGVAAAQTVIDALAGDLADGRLDGLGADADPTTALVTHLHAAEIALELLANRLEVGGAVRSEATAALDNAIAASQPAATRFTADLTATAGLIGQLVPALGVARAIDTADRGLLDLQFALRGLAPGASAATVRALAGGAAPIASVLGRLDQQGAPGVGELLALAHRGPGTATPVAVDDRLTLAGTSGALDLLANDRGLGDAPIGVRLVGAARHGAVVLDPDGLLRYTAAAGWSGSETLGYELIDRDGDVASAQVELVVACAGSGCARTFRVSWNLVAGVRDYCVYRGPRPRAYEQRRCVSNAASLELVSTDPGDHYFAVTAIAASGAESDYSNEVQVGAR